MKKLLLIAFGLVVAGTIAFAICGRTSSDSPNVEAAVDLGDVGVLGADNCLSDFWMVYCIPGQSGWCECGFGVKHLEHSDDCCNHAPGTILVNFGGGQTWHEMTWTYTELGACDKMVYTVSGIVLPDGIQTSYTVVCSADSTNCRGSGWVKPECGS